MVQRRKILLCLTAISCLLGRVLSTSPTVQKQQQQQQKQQQPKQQQLQKDKDHKPPPSNASSTNTSSGVTKPTSATNNIELKGQPNPPHRQQNHERQSQNEQFLKWCQTTLGIQTLAKIKDFEYVDHMNEWKYRRKLQSSNNSKTKQEVVRDIDNAPIQTVQVRGLAATRNINVGEVIISVPYHALLTLHTTIDHDPVLSRILGPEQRIKYGWALHQTGSHANVQSGKEIMESTSYYEIALLVVALLYHVSLGRLSPLWFYVDVLWNAPVDHMPFLWSEEKMKREFHLQDWEMQEDDGPSSFASLELVKLVRGIKKDIHEMYDSIMPVLIKHHGEIFAPKKKENGHQVEDDDSGGWMFSYSRFEWAFAMVNARHWHLPLQELDETWMEMKNVREDPDPAIYDHAVIDDVHSMPASQPTDEYISLQDEALKKESLEEYVLTSSPASLQEISTVTKHSFMAPLADMINYGPPCARGQYNTDKKAFEVVATCPFQEGDEITFWYSDDCEDVIIANYGFTHPMVPRCPTIEDWKYRAKLWKEYAESLERTLSDTYEDLYDTLRELKECNCEEHRIQGTAPAVARGVNGHLIKMKKQQKQIQTNKVKENQKQNVDGNGQGRIRRTKRTVEEEREDVGL